MSVSSISVIQGDSLDVDFRFTDNRVLTNYTCQLQVRDSSDVITGIDRAITDYSDGNTRFIARLTPAETGALSVGSYKLSGQLYEADSDTALELVADLTVTKQYNF